MKEKITKIFTVISLITVLLGVDLIFTGVKAVEALSETNVENITFDAYLKDGEKETYSKTAIISQGEKIYINIALAKTGAIQDGKIKIEDANFKIQPIENQYIKNVNSDTNEIELNEIIVGHDVKIEIPIKFEKTAQMNKDYISQEAKVKFSGNYHDNNRKKAVKGEKKISINWKETAEVEIEQNIEKYINLSETTLIQEKINTKMENNILVNGKTITTKVPQIEGNLPEEVEVLVNGTKANIENYNYDKEKRTITITNKKIDTKEDEYKVIYQYKQPIQQEKLQMELNTKVEVSHYTDEKIEKEKSDTIEVQKTNNKVSIKNIASDTLYKGYMYTGKRNTNYTDKIEIEISTLEDISEIEIKNFNDNFKNASEAIKPVNNSTYIKEIKFTKENLENILGKNFEIKITGENDKELATVKPDSNWDKGSIAISLEEQEIEKIKIKTSKPEKIGTLKIEINKYVKESAGYNREQLKTFTKLENTKTILVNDIEIPANSVSKLEDTIAESKIEINKSRLSTYSKNENVQISAILKSNSEKHDLYKNPYIEIRLPEELEEININSTNILYADGLQIKSAQYNNDTKAIQIQFEGEQNDFRTNVEEGIQVTINANLSFRKNMASKETAISMIYRNENRNGEQNETSTKVKLTSKYGAIWYNNISGYNQENTTIESTGEKLIEAELEPNESEKHPIVKQSFINNYESPIDSITIIGNLGGEDSEKEGIESNFETNLIQNVAVSGASVKISYSNKENAEKDDESWQENITNLQDVKSYKIELEKELQPAEKIDIAYQLNIPQSVGEGAKTYQVTKATYNYNGQNLSNTSAISLASEGTKIEGEKSENGGIKTEIAVISGNKEIKEGEEIPEGQAIKYTINITNNTGKDLTNLKMIAEHTNAIYYIQEEKEAELTNSEIPEIMQYTRKNEEATNITKTKENIKNGETVKFVYDIEPRRKDGDETVGTIKIYADNLKEQQVQTIKNKIKAVPIAVSIESLTDENAKTVENEYVFYNFQVKNLTNKDISGATIQILTDGLKHLEDSSENEIKSGDVVEELEETKEEKENKIKIVENTGNVVKISLPTIKAQTAVSLDLDFKADEIPDNEITKNSTIYSTVELENNKYYSNFITREIKRNNPTVTGVQYSNMQDKEIKQGDKITYTAELENKDQILAAEPMEILHEVTEGNAKIESAYIKKENGEKIPIEIAKRNSVDTTYILKQGEKIEYVAEVLICDNDENPSANLEDTVNSKIDVMYNIGGVLELNELKNTMAEETNQEKEDEDINPSEENPTEPNKPNENDNNKDNNNNNNSNNNNNNNAENNNLEKHNISGIAWIDENKNGIRDNNEKRMANINVELINTITGETVTNKTTNGEGSYKFTDIVTGNYIIVFNYDDTHYQVTNYKIQSAGENKDSNVIRKELNGKVVAATDTLTLTNKDLENMDAGFAPVEDFDFRLDKSIVRVIVQNAEGTKKVEYNKTKLAKVEIPGKYVANSMVIVEYTIQVTNEGKLPGYVDEVVDYMPKDLQFNSEINKDWYIGTDGNLHNISLANTQIKAGESKELKLTLMKQMTLDNTGTSKNIAEIGKLSNDQSIADKDSTANNRKDGEDDISTAELLISVKTGVFTISVGAISILILTGLAFVIYMKKKEGGK